MVENLQEKSIVAQRRVYDNILHCGGTLNFVVTDKIMSYCKQSNRKYREALEKTRQEDAKKAHVDAEKRKLQEEIKSLE